MSYLEARDVTPGMAVRSPYGPGVLLRVVELLGPRPGDGALQFRVIAGQHPARLRTAVFRPGCPLLYRDGDQKPGDSERTCAHCAAGLLVHCLHHLLPCCPGECPGPGGLRRSLAGRWAET